MAAKTWTGEWWKYGGGGTVWDGMAYDADADLLYIGTGNGGPWDRDFRSPQGGDNLFLPRSSPSRPTPAGWRGITSRCPAISGTTPPRSR